MASIPIVNSNTVSKGAGGSFVDRVLSAGKTVAKGAGDVVQGVLGNETVQKWSGALLDVYVAKQAARIERDLSRERPEAAQAGAGGANGQPASASASVTGGPPGGALGNLGVPLAIGGAAVLALVVVLALRR